jgi:hypothetical protein
MKYKVYFLVHGYIMETFRVKLVFRNGKWIVLGQPKLYGNTKQELYKILKEELDLKRVYTRRSSVVCVEK